MMYQTSVYRLPMNLDFMALRFRRGNCHGKPGWLIFTGFVIGVYLPLVFCN
jgi:hypothetical protein